MRVRNEIKPPAGRAEPLTGRVTMQDVARAASVSLMTVSNVINGKAGQMTEETRRRVEEAIRNLRYRPHMRGRRLRMERNLSVGMIIVDERGSFLADPFITQLITGLNDHFFACGYGLYLQGVKPDRINDSILVRNVETDGICTLVSGPPEVRQAIYRRLIELGQPLVVFQEPMRFRGEDVCVIRQDDAGGARLIAEHVLAKGARRLVVLRPALDWAAVDERLRGMREAIAATPGATYRIVLGDSLDFKVTETAIAADIDRNGLPDAILAANDQLAIAAMKMLSALGASVPGQVRVTGFNGFELWQYTEPPLTTVHSAAYEMGRLAGKTLLHRLEHGRFTSKNAVLDVKPLIGGSA